MHQELWSLLALLALVLLLHKGLQPILDLVNLVSVGLYCGLVGLYQMVRVATLFVRIVRIYITCFTFSTHGGYGFGGL